MFLNGLLAREPGDIGEPDERLDAERGADCEHEPVELGARAAFAQ
jgi:hypothetical protein